MTVVAQKQPEDVTLVVQGVDGEFDPVFLRRMVAAMTVSYFKYGAVADAAKTRKTETRGIDFIASLQLRLDKYAETGNTEYLIDAANFAMMEYMHPAPPWAHYTPTDSDGSPGRATGVGAQPQDPQAPNDARAWW